MNRLTKINAAFLIALLIADGIAIAGAFMDWNSRLYMLFAALLIGQVLGGIIAGVSRLAALLSRSMSRKGQV